MRYTITVFVLTLLAGSLARAQQADPTSLLSPAEPLFTFDESLFQDTGSSSALPFGSQDTQHLMFGSMVGPDFRGNVDVSVHGQYTYFVIDDFEVGVEAAFWGFFQDDSTVGVSTSLVMRYHFYQAERWSAFAEAGMGVMAAGDDVPDTGTSFNLMPRFGAGLTWQMFEDSSTRLITGLRWHHISNARMKGEEDNPARDGPGLYVGLLYDF